MHNVRLIFTTDQKDTVTWRCFVEHFLLWSGLFEIMTDCSVSSEFEVHWGRTNGSRKIFIPVKNQVNVRDYNPEFKHENGRAVIQDDIVKFTVEAIKYKAEQGTVSFGNFFDEEIFFSRQKDTQPLVNIMFLNLKQQFEVS